MPPPEPGAAALPPAIVVQGGADSVVRALNGDRVADQWLAHRAAAVGDDAVGRSRSDTGRTTDGRAYHVLRWYTARGRKVLEYWLVDGLGHAWSGGRKDGSFSDPRGPRATTLMWAFFRLHALDRRSGRRLGPRDGGLPAAAGQRRVRRRSASSAAGSSRAVPAAGTSHARSSDDPDPWRRIHRDLRRRPPGRR